MRYEFSLLCVGGVHRLSAACSPKTPPVKCVEPAELGVLDMGQNPCHSLGVVSQGESQGETVTGLWCPGSMTSGGSVCWLIVCVNVPDRRAPGPNLILALSVSIFPDEISI